MVCWILIKNSSSKCNEELLTWLHSNINTIKKKLSLKVIIVYENLYPKLDGKIKKLPVLIVNNGTVTGNAAIKKSISGLVSTAPQSSQQPATQPLGNNNDLTDFWNAEMHSGGDEDNGSEEDVMDQVKRKALNVSSEHKASLKQKPKRRETIVSSSRDDNIQMKDIEPAKISDMVGNDSMMQSFWENQETTPGF